MLAVLAAIVAALFTIPTPYQLLMPGPVVDVQRSIHPYNKPLKGALYITTVYSDPASVGTWLYAAIAPDAGVVPRAETRPPNIGEREYQRILGQMMDESKVAAKVVALRAAGYDVQITGQGAQVQDIAETSRARGIVQSGDIVVAVDGREIATANDLVTLVQSRRPGDVVQMRVRRGEGDLTLAVPLGESPDEPGRARAGLVIITHLFAYELPKEVDVETREIGGPSAGLMFALGVYNAVTPGDLVQGRTIAGTGSITTDGQIGAIGGVEYKIRAAESARVSIFLVPRANYDDARRAAHSKMQIVPVDTFNDALVALGATPAVPRT